ncbi:hypothetical protein PSM7751_02593 [Pseudooceanicola marinus]|uniref:Uncharacterized protein n=1 Tax=Pseudooceanicola marinus TaxID=396013 RepID=A0A1X6ZK11_9RHOB|nr:hypothetical protein [Pseudooceanicola marinus]PJE31559.1 hypothetical protein CVM50_07655 [Pseudooceanicola marinus]SLN53713.1 hypothetical protein PSM7751_02593 [Pseudooceanicola marinus]
MSLDVIFVCGALLCLLAIPALVSAWADNRIPSVSVFALLSGTGLTVYAWYSDPVRLAPSKMPDAFIRVFAELLRAI